MLIISTGNLNIHIDLAPELYPLLMKTFEIFTDLPNEKIMTKKKLHKITKNQNRVQFHRIQESIVERS